MCSLPVRGGVNTDGLYESLIRSVEYNGFAGRDNSTTIVYNGSLNITETRRQIFHRIDWSDQHGWKMTVSGAACFRQFEASITSTTLNHKISLLHLRTTASYNGIFETFKIHTTYMVHWKITKLEHYLNKTKTGAFTGLQVFSDKHHPWPRQPWAQRPMNTTHHIYTHMICASAVLSQYPRVTNRPHMMSITEPLQCNAMLVKD